MTRILTAVLTSKPENIQKITIIYENETSHDAVVLDTFDYLLIKSGRCFWRTGAGIYVLFADGEIFTSEGTVHPAQIEVIDKVIKPRVLLEKHNIVISKEDIHLMDELEKTIGNGELLSLELGGYTAFVINVSPLRGYEKDVEDFLGAVKQTDGGIAEAVGGLAENNEDKLVNYTSKPVLGLSGEMALAEVMKSIYTHLLDVMELNAQGIIDDIDIEFLHDFRVSVRRLRSALSLVKGVYDPDTEKDFKARFKYLGSLTGLARDMDVYLEKIDGYEEMLPDWLKGGMQELFDHFKNTREQEYRKLAEYLSSGEFAKLVKDFRKVLNSKKYITDKGRSAVLGNAEKAVWKSFKSIEKQAKVMDADTHSDAVHEIRISFKKIRYLMEFYSSLFDKEQTSQMLKDMKVLQDSLGDHNDYHVQQMMLVELIRSGNWGTKTSTACGFLSAVLSQKQRQEKEHALVLISEFMNYKPLFVELFK